MRDILDPCRTSTSLSSSDCEGDCEGKGGCVFEDELDWEDDNCMGMDASIVAFCFMHDLRRR